MVLCSVTPVGVGSSLGERLRRGETEERSLSHIAPPRPPCAAPVIRQAANSGVGILYEVGDFGRVQGCFHRLTS